MIEHTGRRIDYSYDDAWRLTREQIQDPVFGSRDISYTLDAVGNRLMKTDNGAVTSYTYDDNDCLLSEVYSQSSVGYQYDLNGNTITKNSAAENISYVYDYNNRLIQVDNGSSLIEYGYDVNGIRVQKSVNGNATHYLIDDNLGYAQVLEEYNGSGALQAQYVHGHDLICQSRSGSVSYYHYDGFASVRSLTNSSAQVTDDYAYDAFGQLLIRTGATVNNYLYRGEQFDPDLGQYYLRARYYNQSIGRFSTMDNWSGIIHDPVTLHKYLYANSNPLMYIDPSGNMAVTTGLSFGHVTSIQAMMGKYMISPLHTALNYMRFKYYIAQYMIGAGLGVAGFLVGSVLKNQLQALFHPDLPEPVDRGDIEKGVIRSAITGGIAHVAEKWVDKSMVGAHKLHKMIIKALISSLINMTERAYNDDFDPDKKMLIDNIFIIMQVGCSLSMAFIVGVINSGVIYLLVDAPEESEKIQPKPF
ncbi:MAG: RHS repeat-associated core domain-containing protein, partial [Bacteroidales bacterium]|nr:RHS repeat-associated core domain-containing protein [Bacteroidales bacterium]